MGNADLCCLKNLVGVLVLILAFYPPLRGEFLANKKSDVSNK